MNKPSPQINIMKSSSRNPLTDEHLKYCFHLCLSNYEPYIPHSLHYQQQIHDTMAPSGSEHVGIFSLILQHKCLADSFVHVVGLTS
jgi:hypothetical protein